MHDDEQGRHVDIGDTALWVVERGTGDGYPLILLHGGPGDDHHEFGDYLDPLGDRFRLLLVDQRAQGNSAPADERTWSLHQMAADVVLLARALRLERYAVLGHSYGAFVALQNAVDFPGMASQSVISSGLPSSRFLEAVETNLATFEPVELREQVAASWAREAEVQTPEEFAEIMRDQAPFHFADPQDPRIEEYERRRAGTRFSPQVLKAFAAAGYGGIEVEDRLGKVEHPVLILHGLRERTCVFEGATAMANAIPNADLVVFEESAHMTFVEENEKYLAAVRSFLNRQAGA